MEIYGSNIYALLNLKRYIFPKNFKVQFSVASLATESSCQILAKQCERKKEKYEVELEYMKGKQDVITDLLPEYPGTEMLIHHIFSNSKKNLPIAG